MALPKYTKAQLAEEVAERSGLSRADVKKVLDGLDETVFDNLTSCIRTEIAGVIIAPAISKATKKRKGRNPQTGEEVDIAAKPTSVRVALRATTKLKAAVPSVQKLKSKL